MNAPSFRAGCSLRLAPHITVTRLPFGGAVLVNGVTLGLAECGELDADVLDRLLTRGFPGPDGGAGAGLAEQMIKAGWLVAVPASDQSDQRW
jgi:hypothetical protein